MTTSEIAREASAALLGTCDSLEIWLDDHYPEADPNEIGSLLEIERCPECDWWVEVGELVFGDGELVACGSCLSRYMAKNCIGYRPVSGDQTFTRGPYPQ